MYVEHTRFLERTRNCPVEVKQQAVVKSEAALPSASSFATVERGADYAKIRGASSEREAASAERGGASVEMRGASSERGGASAEMRGAAAERGGIMTPSTDRRTQNSSSPARLVKLVN